MSDARRRTLARTGGLSLLVAGLALFGVGRTWGSGASGYLMARTVDAPLLWLFVATMGVLVLWAGRKASRGRTALDVLGWVLVPVVALSVLRFTMLSGSSEPAHRSVSPDGSRALVVDSVSSVFDPEWEVRVETGHGLTTRYRVLNCVNGDWSNVESAQWLSPTTAKIVHRSDERTSDEIATTVTSSGSIEGRVDMSGHGLDTCAPGADGSRH